VAHVTALWTVVVLLAILAAVDSVAVIALTRQVGLLHMRVGQPHTLQAQVPPPRGPLAGGLPAGARLRLDVPPDIIGTGSAPDPDLILFGFVRPACGGCAVALPAFASVAAGLPPNERVVLVSDADDAAARAYLVAHRVTLPLVSGPDLLRVNGIPSTPYAVVADRGGHVMAAVAVISTGQLEACLGQARSAQAAARSGTPLPPATTAAKRREE
jgi:hypothetical protein